jgi:hypothetical protein
MVVTPSFTHLSITFNNQRFSSCSPTVDAGFVKLTSDSFCGNRVCKMNIQFCRHLSYSSCDFSKQFSMYDDLFLSLFLFADVVYDDTTLETVAVNTPNNVTDAPRYRARTICRHSKSDNSPVFRHPHTDGHSTQSLIH